MSSTLYNKAFEIHLSHNFYVYSGAPVDNEFKVNKDIELFPTIECSNLMRSGRMRFSRTPKGLVMFYQAYKDGGNNVQPFVRINNGSEFVFGIRLDVAALSEFLNVSNLNVGSKTYGAGKFFMLNGVVDNSTANPPQTLSLTATLANSLRPSVFSYSFKPSQTYSGLADIIVTFDDTSTDVLIISKVPYDPDTNTYCTGIDLSGEKKGFYTLKAYKTGSTLPIDELDSNDFYVDSDLYRDKVFGILRVTYDNASLTKLYGTRLVPVNYYSFSYLFNARALKWRYYIVAQNVDSNFFTTYDLAVIDANNNYIFYASYPPAPSMPPFTQPNGQPDQKIKINGFPTVILMSTTTIPFSEKALLDINLKKWLRTSGPYQTYINNLPNANPEGVDGDQWGAAQTPPTITSGIAEIFVVI